MDRNQDAHRSHSLPAMAWSESVNFGVRNKIVCALAEAEHPAIVTGGVDNKILGVNRSWCELCDYQASECLDKSPKILQGCGTDFYEAKKFAQRLANKSGGDGDVCAALLNYTKAGVPFLHILRGRAIYDPSTGSKYYITESSGRKLDNFEEHMLGVADAELVKRRSTRCSSESSQAGYLVEVAIGICHVAKGVHPVGEKTVCAFFSKSSVQECCKLQSQNADALPPWFILSPISRLALR
eukprot:2415277-Pleurochrysis_carterae.AAC.2